MINLYRDNPTNTFAVYPDVTASYASNPNAVYTITLTQDYDKSQTQFTGSLINSPNRVNPRLVFQVTGSVVPEWSGFYSYNLSEALYTGYQWSQANLKWSEANNKWSEAQFLQSSSLIDSDRAKVKGSDTIVPTQYTGSQLNGAYTTYHL